MFKMAANIENSLKDLKLTERAMLKYDKVFMSGPGTSIINEWFWNALTPWRV